MAVVGASASWDSNVFRLPAGQAATTQEGRRTRSDRIASGYVGLRADQPYKQQRFTLDATYTAYRYHNFEHLDFEALNYRGAWLWHLTPHVSGTLSAERSESLANYADFRNTSQRNVRTSENRLASANAALFGGWYLTGGLNQSVAKSSQPIADEGSFRADGGELGVKYLTRAGTSLRLNWRVQDGRYTDRLASFASFTGDGFQRRETELLFAWTLTGRTGVDARLARIDYDENQFSQRDFTATAVRMGTRWSPTGRVVFSLDVARTPSSWRDNAATYKVDDTVALGGSWQLTSRTSLRSSYSAGRSRFRNPIVAPASPRRDNFRLGSIGADWKPPYLRNLSVNASLQAQDRRSTDDFARYDTSVLSLGASLTF